MLPLSTMEDTAGQLQRIVDIAFRDRMTVSRLDVVVLTEALDPDEDVLAIVALLPPGPYSRQRLCDQINSAVVGHGWSRRLGTVD